MPKPYDVKHNYYADLELQTSASVEDVKKQYRKLALLYHPDRNAGKEQEVIPKFQAIQAAHEILSDQAQKTKYDADRRKAGLYPNLSGAATGGNAPRGNPYQASSAYPPPPRRTNPGTWQRPQPAASTTRPNAGPSGADRFTNFPRAAPTAKQPDPAADRTNAFRAWQNMNTAQERQQQQSQAQQQQQQQQQPQSRYFSAGAQAQSSPNVPPRRPQPPPRQDTKFPSDEKIRAGFSYRDGPPPQQGPSVDRADERQSAWAAFQQGHAGKPGVSRSNTTSTRTPRKNGFDPNAPGSDERPAPESAHYVHRHKSEDFGRPSPVPPPPPGPPPSQPASPLSPGSQRPHADPLRPFRSRTTDEEVPYAEGNRVRTPYSSFIGERTDFSGGMRRAASTRDTTKLNGDSSADRPRSTSPLGRHASTKGHEHQQHHHPNQQKPSFTVGDSSDSSNDSSETEMTHTPEQFESPFARPGKKTVPPHDRPIKKPTPPSRRFNDSTNPKSPQPADGAADDSGLRQKSTSNIFSFPIDPNTFTPSANGKSRSEENINTKFSAEGWSGTFSGSADYFAPPASTGSRRGSPSMRGQRPGLRSATSHYPQSPNATNGFDPSKMPPPPPPAPPVTDPNAPEPTSAGSEVKFSKEQWENTFKDASWTWPPPPPKPPGSPAKGGAKGKAPSRKGSRASARLANAASGTAANPHVVDEQQDDTPNLEKVKSHASHASTHSGIGPMEPDPMDIDNTPPAAPQINPQQPSAVPQQRAPRMVSVPPSAWHLQNDQQSNGNHTRNVSSGSGPALPPKLPLQTNLDDLNHVAPFGPSTDNPGLQDLHPLSTTLPFASQAATTLPTHPLKPLQLKMPVVPIPPKAPTRLSKESWHRYAQNFATYLRAFHHFNSAMLTHFSARETQNSQRLAGSMAWLEAAGDTTGNGASFGVPGLATGYGSYAQGVKEDERVRETWGVGCERHAEAVRAFEEVRERVRKLVGSGALVER